MRTDPLYDPELGKYFVELLTPRQLETLRLESMGMSARNIALAQGVARQTVRGCLLRAHFLAYRAGLRRRNDGTWYLKGGYDDKCGPVYSPE